MPPAQGQPSVGIKVTAHHGSKGNKAGRHGHWPGAEGGERPSQEELYTASVVLKTLGFWRNRTTVLAECRRALRGYVASEVELTQAGSRAEPVGAWVVP